MIKDAGSKFDDYSIFLKIRQNFIAIELWINWKKNLLTWQINV